MATRSLPALALACVLAAPGLGAERSDASPDAREAVFTLAAPPALAGRERRAPRRSVSGSASPGRAGGRARIRA